MPALGQTCHYGTCGCIWTCSHGCLHACWLVTFHGCTPELLGGRTAHSAVPSGYTLSTASAQLANASAQSALITSSIDRAVAAPLPAIAPTLLRLHTV